MKHVRHLAFKFNQDWMCNFSFMVSTEHRLAIASVVEDEYSWYEAKQSLKGMLFLLGNLKYVSEITKFLLGLVMGHS